MEPEPPSYLFGILLTTNSVELISLLIILISLLILSALFSGSEVAFFSLNKKLIEDAKEEEHPKIDLIEKQIKNKPKLLATILIGNNAVNIAIVLISAYISLNYLHLESDTFHVFGWELAIEWQIVFDLIFITLLLLIFGEIIPKIYAGKQPLKLASFTVKAVEFLTKVFSPLSSILMTMSGLIEKRLTPRNNISVNELSQALELTYDDEQTTNEEQKILEGIVNFGNTETRQIMTPRVDTFALEVHTPYKNVLAEVSANGFSRIPIYEESMDQIVGVLYAKDLIPHIHKEKLHWEDLLREPFFVPEVKKIDDLLSDFQEKKIHLAIVVDEYGGTSGIVSLEDVIEEIVGDISDEFDDESLNYSKLDENNFVFEGKISLKDFYRVMDIEEEDIFDQAKGDSESLAGFILEISEKEPKQRSVLNFDVFTFTIESMDKKRIKRIKVTKNINQ